MDPAETLRAALTRQHHARRNYDEAKNQEIPEESPEERALRLEDLRAAAEAADAEMDRLRPAKPPTDDRQQEGISPPMGPLSN
jgi:hypothetical protein